jgi:hypothetical protein
LPACTSSAIAPTVSSIGTSRVDAVLVVEVDDVDAEPLQRRVAAGAHVLGRPLMPRKPPAVAASAHVAELGGEHDLVAPARDRRPTSCSLVNGPYMSAVSRKVTPRSSARWIVAIDSARRRAP